MRLRDSAHPSHGWIESTFLRYKELVGAKLDPTLVFAKLRSPRLRAPGYLLSEHVRAATMVAEGGVTSGIGAHAGSMLLSHGTGWLLLAHA